MLGCFQGGLRRRLSLLSRLLRLREVALMIGRKLGLHWLGRRILLLLLAVLLHSASLGRLPLEYLDWLRHLHTVI
jgi:hypothetical protein